MLNSPLYLNGIGLKRGEVRSFDEYPFSLPAVRKLRNLRLKSPVTFLVGENGSGKSTLLEAIASSWGFNPEGGSRNMMFATRPSESGLHEYLSLERGLKRPADGFFLRAESFFNVATEVDKLEMASAYGGKSLHEQSHGESFMALMTTRLRGDGLYLMDEPEAALSPSRQMSLLALVHRFVGQGAQLIIATHSPILMAYPDARILELGEWGMRPVAYEATEHFTVTRDFLNRYPSMLRALLDESPDRPERDDRLV